MWDLPLLKTAHRFDSHKLHPISLMLFTMQKHLIILPLILSISLVSCGKNQDTVKSTEQPVSLVTQTPPKQAIVTDTDMIVLLNGYTVTKSFSGSIELWKEKTNSDLPVDFKIG